MRNCCCRKCVLAGSNFCVVQMVSLTTRKAIRHLCRVTERVQPVCAGAVRLSDLEGAEHAINIRLRHQW